MSIFKAYIIPFDDAGNFSTEIDVTGDLIANSVSNLSRTIDQDRYQVGLFNYDKLNIKLRNELGTYSEPGSVNSIFKFRRGGSKFRLTWQTQDYNTQCGVAEAGNGKLSPEITVFDGILNDEAAKLDIDDQQTRFDILGVDSIFDAVEIPFSDLSIGDLYSEALLTILDQTILTNYLTVSASNINVGLDQTIDVISELENATVKEALDRLLFQSSSVMYIEDNTIYISNRDGGLTSEKTFYGQASDDGIEEIINISNVRTGINNVFNLWTWSGEATASRDEDSIIKNGVKKSSVGFDEITTLGKKQAILDQLKTDFGTANQEFVINVPITYENLELNILDQVRVDYPTTYFSGSTLVGVPLYGVSKYDEATYPYGEFSLVISPATPFKILGIKVDLKKQTIEYKLKEQ